MDMSDRLKRIFQSMHFRMLIIMLLVGLVPANIMLRGILTGYLFLLMRLPPPAIPPR